MHNINHKFNRKKITEKRSSNNLIADDKLVNSSLTACFVSVLIGINLKTWIERSCFFLLKKNESSGHLIFDSLKSSLCIRKKLNYAIRV